MAAFRNQPWGFPRVPSDSTSVDPHSAQEYFRGILLQKLLKRCLQNNEMVCESWPFSIETRNVYLKMEQPAIYCMLNECASCMPHTFLDLK